MLWVLKRRSCALSFDAGCAAAAASGAAAIAAFFAPDFLATGAFALAALPLTVLVTLALPDFFGFAAPAGASAKEVSRSASAIFVLIIVIGLVNTSAWTVLAHARDGPPD